MRCSGFSTLVASVLVLTVLGVAPSAHAQRTLTLDEALSLARKKNRDLRAARGRLEQSAAGVELAWAALLPQAAVQGRYTHNYKEVALDFRQLSGGVLGLAEALKSTSQSSAQVDAINQFEQQLSRAPAQSIVIQKGEQLNVALNVTVPLVVPFAYPDLAASKSSHRASRASYAVTEATILLAVAQTYFAAAGADELLVARRNAVAVAKQTLERAKARLQAGAATSVDTGRAEVALVRAEQAEAEAEDVQAHVYRSLSTLLATHEALRASPASSPPSEPVSDPMLVESARRQRPEFEFYRRALDASASSASALAWRWAPTLSAFGNLQAFNYQSFSGDKYSWAVGLQLDWVLYDGGVRDAQRHRLEAQRRELEAGLELLGDTVTDEVLNARRALGTQRRALQAALRASELSQETLRLIRVQYESGRATQLDLLQAQDSLVSANVGVAQARFALALADLQLRKSTGTFPSRQRSEP